MSVTSQTISSSYHKGNFSRRLGNRRIPAPVRSRQIELYAAELLEQHPHFRGRSRFVEIRCTDRCITLGGCLPTYYLKQLAQETLRGIKDVEIVNEISVFAMIGEPVTDMNESLQSHPHKRKPR